MIDMHRKYVGNVGTELLVEGWGKGRDGGRDKGDDLRYGYDGIGRTLPDAVPYVPNPQSVPTHFPACV